MGQNPTEVVSGTAETDGQCQAVMEPPGPQGISCLGSCRLQVSKRGFGGRVLFLQESGSDSSQWMRSYNKNTTGFGQTYCIM